MMRLNKQSNNIIKISQHLIFIIIIIKINIRNPFKNV